MSDRMIADPVSQAETLLAQGRTQQAVAIVLRAGADGHGGALFRHAMWKLAGAPLPRDLEGARSLLRRSTETGNLDAALTEVALVANGTGGVADWAHARELLGRISDRSAMAADQLSLLTRMALTPEGDPDHAFPVRKIGDDPVVWQVTGLFTPAECLHVAQNAVEILQPAMVVDPRTGQAIPSPVRTSDGAVIGPTRETLVIQTLNRRIAAVTNSDVRQGEALSVLRYQPGQYFQPHLDAIANVCNQRIKTVLIYLNDTFTGGETRFVHNGLKVRPRTGDAIIFDNVRIDGSIDPATQHAGEPVTRGTKWLATRWLRARAFDVWKGPEAGA